MRLKIIVALIILFALSMFGLLRASGSAPEKTDTAPIVSAAKPAPAPVPAPAPKGEAPVFAPNAGTADEPIKIIEDTKTYRIVNGEPILGRDVLDLVLEDHWDTQLQAFIEHQLRTDEISSANITIGDQEVDAELQNLLNAQAKRMGVDPKDLKIEEIVRKGGVVGGIATLKRNVRENIGMLRLLQKEKKLPADISVADRLFQEAMRERLDKRIAEKGVVTNPKRLGGGEACRIGARGFSK
ncbi:MAG TPA: hypothetical protein VEJ63_19640, partial [Planctomycetota bacterium]|nr:hypothetical protein [Planctomycetota bacterium]